jgi:hypothetical protein
LLASYHSPAHSPRPSFRRSRVKYPAGRGASAFAEQRLCAGEHQEIDLASAMLSGTQKMAGAGCQCRGKSYRVVKFRLGPFIQFAAEVFYREALLLLARTFLFKVGRQWQQDEV